MGGSLGQTQHHEILHHEEKLTTWTQAFDPKASRVDPWFSTHNKLPTQQVPNVISVNLSLSGLKKLKGNMLLGLRKTKDIAYVFVSVC